MDLERLVFVCDLKNTCPIKDSGMIRLENGLLRK